MNKKWTAEEIKKLYKLYKIECMPLNDISKILNRSKAGIWKQINRNKFNHTKEEEKRCRSSATSGPNNGMYGKKSWSNGLTKNTDNRLKNSSKNISKTRKKMFKNGELQKPIGNKNGMFGRKPWNN